MTLLPWSNVNLWLLTWGAYMEGILHSASSISSSSSSSSLPAHMMGNSTDSTGSTIWCFRNACVVTQTTLKSTYILGIKFRCFKTKKKFHWDFNLSNRDLLNVSHMNSVFMNTEVKKSSGIKFCWLILPSKITKLNKQLFLLLQHLYDDKATFMTHSISYSIKFQTCLGLHTFLWQFSQNESIIQL